MSFCSLSRVQNFFWVLYGYISARNLNLNLVNFALLCRSDHPSIGLFKKNVKMFHKCTLRTDSTSFLPKVLPEAPWHVKLRSRFKKSHLVSFNHPEIFEYFHSRAAVHRESKRHVKHYPGFIIHPLSEFRKHWNVFIFFMFFLHQIMTPFIVAFYIEIPDYLIDTAIIIDFFTCLMLMAEIVLKFRTGYIVEETNEIILKPRNIILKYLKNCVPDVITSIPFIYVASLLVEERGGTVSGITILYLCVLFCFSFYRFREVLFYFRTIPKRLQLSEKTQVFLVLALRTYYVQVFYGQLENALNNNSITAGTGWLAFAA